MMVQYIYYSFQNKTGKMLKINDGSNTKLYIQNQTRELG